MTMMMRKERLEIKPEALKFFHDNHTFLNEVSNFRMVQIP